MNNNTNNHNGKEVIKPQSQGNVPREGGPKHANRTKKKNVTSGNEVHPVEQKKINLNIKKKEYTGDKQTTKGNVIRLEDKAGKIYPVEPQEKRSIRPKINKPSFTSNEKANSTDNLSVNPILNPTDNKIGEKESLKSSNKTGTILLVAAVVFFIAWIIIFFYNNIGGNTHMLLGLAIICGIIGLLSNKKNKN